MGIGSKYKELDGITLKQVKAHKEAPAIFRPVIARIVDFYPEKLEDAVVLQCSQCKNMCVMSSCRLVVWLMMSTSSIPKDLRICTSCVESMDDDHTVPVYRFCFQIEDELGERLNVAAGNPGVRSCLIFIAVM